MVSYIHGIRGQRLADVGAAAWRYSIPAGKHIMSPNTDTVRIIPLGGLGEFGMNSMLFEDEGTRFMVDCGVMFPQPEHPGVDFIRPSFEVLEDRPIDALVLTHGHEDHIGGIPFLLRCRHRFGQMARLPVHGTRFTLELVRRRLDEHDLYGAIQLITFSAGDILELGSVSVETIGVNHSIPGAVALAIETSSGTIVHSGDWRLDHRPINEPVTDLSRFAALGDRGVRLLLSDSTNVGREGSSASETAVYEALEDVFDLAPGRVIMTMFSSNIWRLQSVLRAAYETGRRVLVVGRSLQRNLGIAREVGHLTLPTPDILMSAKELPHQLPEEVVIVASGSQGEPRSSMTRIAYGQHNDVQVSDGDWVIYSSRRIPGNERRIGHVIDELHLRGAEVMQPGERMLHTTGHACREEQRLLMSLVKPAAFVPVHGGFQQLTQHAALGREMGIPVVRIIRDGDVLAVGQDSLAIVDEVAAAARYESGNVVVDDEILKARRQLAITGVVIVVVMRADDGTPVGTPRVRTYGVGPEDDALLQRASEAARQTMKDADWDDSKAVAEEVRISVRRVFRKALNYKPLVLVELVDVP